MKKQANIIRLCILTVSLYLLLSTVFALDETLANGVVSAKYFWFYMSMGIVSTASLLLYGFRRDLVMFYIVDLLLILFAILVLANNYFAFNNATDTKWILLLLLLLLFISLRVALHDEKLRFHIILFFIFTGLVEAIWGLSQLYSSAFSSSSQFNITGSFFNSGPYSGYLAVVAPLALYYIMKDVVVFKRDIFSGYLSYYLRFTISILTFVCIVIVLPTTMSRAAWLSMIVGCVFVLLAYYSRQKKNLDFLIKRQKQFVLLLFIAFVLIASSLVGIYLLKKNSAEGRLLIWKTSMQMVTKYPMGVGIGHFSGAYGYEQASYFASGEASAQEQLIAGSPEYTFNEYLQIIIELGVVPAAILFSSLVLLLFMGLKRKIIAETGGLLSLLVFASMSYPLNLLPFLIVLVVFICLILTKRPYIKVNHFFEKGFEVKWKILFSILTVSYVILFVVLRQQLPIYNAYKEWNNLKMFRSLDAYPEMKNDYENLYPYLGDQIQFLFEYSQCLSKAKEYAKSNSIIERAVKRSCDPMFYNILGKNYQSVGNYKLAEQNFKMASYIVPNRIYPYFLLAKLYFEQGEKRKAIEMTNIVLKKEPKVQSTAIEEMRLEMKKIIKKNEQTNTKSHLYK
jgi:tetratricopeptide (TPR) repeat protein